MVHKTKQKIISRTEKQAQLMKKMGLAHRRNNQPYDWWSLSHILWAMILAWIMTPLYALIIMILWEPLEIFILSPFLAKFGIEFGYESLKNSLSDIVFDVIGVILAVTVLSRYFEPPFFLF